MKTDRPSHTAALIAFMRAVGDAGGTSVRNFSDPIARSILPTPWSLLAFPLGKIPHAARLAWLASFGSVDLAPLRTAAIDAALREFAGEQLVILGAGLDARAYRLPELSRFRIFEVDHPATQNYKRQQTMNLHPMAPIEYVAIDFVSERLDDVLKRSSHRPDAPTFWIWEGVTMYLARPALRETLRAIHACSAAGSQLAATYLQPRRLRKLVTPLFDLVGEPLVGALGREEMESELVAAGFLLRRDTGAKEWCERFANFTPAKWYNFERLALAEPK